MPLFQHLDLAHFHCMYDCLGQPNQNYKNQCVSTKYYLLSLSLSLNSKDELII